MSIQVIHLPVCDICEAGALTTRHDYCPGYAPIVPCPPSGWRWLDGQLICPKHKITVER